MAVLRASLVALLMCVQAPPAQAQSDSDYVQAISHQEYVRVTFYTTRGTMRWGKQTYFGAAACGSYFPAGSKLTFVADDWTVTCEDTGRLQKAHVDIWAPSYSWGVKNVAAFYGDYTWVRVDRWGWGDEE